MNQANNSVEIMSLNDFIERHFEGNNSAFARAQSPLISRQQAQKWLAGDYIVLNGELYLRRRSLNTAPNNKEKT